MQPSAHEMREGESVDLNVEDHPGRTDSPTYLKSKRLLHVLYQKVGANFYGDGAPQDHHSGVLWVYVKDEDAWFMVRNLAGMEWSSQFCADPAKVELLRQNAARLYRGFPETLDAFDAMGFSEMRQILETPITDAAGVALWTDSIFNASQPLPQPVHTGTVDAKDDGSQPIAGIHHYPLPVWDIQFFKHGDFVLFVTTDDGRPAAVVPVAPKGSGDSRVEVIHAEPGTHLHAQMTASHAAGQRHILDASHPLAARAFSGQQP